MFKDDYRKEIDSISASEKFKKDTISLMQQKQAEMRQTETKTVKFSPKPYRKIAAAFAVMALALSVYAYSHSDFAIGDDNAAEGMPNVQQGTDQSSEFMEKDSDYYSLPANVAGNESIKKVYTIKDAAQVAEIPDSDKKKTRLYFNTLSDGGLGFEGYMYYSPSQLEQNPTYTVGDSFETLPVYQFTALSAREIKKEVALECGKLGSGNTDFEYSWYRNVYDDAGNFYSQERAVTYTPNSPSDEYRLHSMDGILTQTYPERKHIGEVHVRAPYGWYNVTLDTVVSDSRNETEISKAVTAAYPKLFNGQDTAYGSFYDYTFSGDINRSAFVYSPSEDYGENIFNYSVNNTRITQFPVSAEDSTWNQTFIRLRLPCYTKLDDLPAITWQQALQQMYSGNYFTSSPVEITPDTAVSHIELVYLEPPYDIKNIEKKGCSVPFYKFFVDMGEDFNRQTENGVMKTYGAYYVCAIHPDYIQLGENYYRFN